METIEKHFEISGKEKTKRSESTGIEKRSMSYLMFMYLEEKFYCSKKKREAVLCRRRKLNLTRKLLWISVNQIEDHDTQDLNNISRDVDHASSLRVRIRNLSQNKTITTANRRSIIKELLA